MTRRVWLPVGLLNLSRLRGEVDALGSAIARQSAAGGGRPIRQRALRKYPHPGPPPQAGEGAHFRRRYS